MVADGVPVVTRGIPSFGIVDDLNRTLRGVIGDTDRPGHCRIVIVPIIMLPYIDPDLRPYVLAPDTGPGSVIRDGGGQIIGVRRLVREPVLS